MIDVLRLEDGTEWALLFRRKDGPGWARVYIERSGNVVASSDWGTYSHCWTLPGGDESEPVHYRVARRILANSERGYLIRKFSGGCPRELRPDETEDRIKAEILQLRRDGQLTAEEARNEWDAVCIEDESDYHVWVNGTELADPWELSVHDYPSDVRAFVDNVIIGWLRPLILEWLASKDA